MTKVSVTYVWNITPENWESYKNNVSDFKDKMEFDPIDMFYHLSDVCRPEVDVNSILINDNKE